MERLTITTETTEQRQAVIGVLADAEDNGELDFSFSTQLMEKDAEVAKLKDQLRDARSGLEAKMFLAVSANYWGRGDSIAVAKAQLRKAGGTTKGEYFVYVTDGEKPYVDGMGYQYGGDESTFLLMIEDTRKPE